MPFCPTCRQEFESFATDCPDCEVKLVPELKVATAPATVAIAVADERAREYIQAMLAQAGVTVKVSGGAEVGFRPGTSLIHIPTPFAQGVLQALGGDPSLAEVEAPKSTKVPVVAAFASVVKRGATDEIRDPPLLKDPIPMLVRRGEAILPELLDLVKRADKESREVAIRAVLAFKDVGRNALSDALASLAREQRSEALYAVARLLRDSKSGPDVYQPLVAVCADSKLHVDARCLALHVLGRSESLSYAPPVLALLDDASELVREAADEALCSLTDDDVGFDPEAAAGDRKRYIDDWKKRLAKRGVSIG